MSFWGTLGKIGLGAGSIGASFIPGVGPLIAKTGLGVLGNMLNTSAYNQPEKFRQSIIEQELMRRNQLQGAAAPTLAGMLGYRSPQMGQQMQAQLGSQKVKR